MRRVYVTHCMPSFCQMIRKCKCVYQNRLWKKHEGVYVYLALRTTLIPLPLFLPLFLPLLLFLLVSPKQKIIQPYPFSFTCQKQKKKLPTNFTNIILLLFITYNTFDFYGRRMQLLHLYGPHVFEEAVIDPIKTMKKDVLPRFVVSDICQELINNLALCEPLPSADMLQVVAPSSDEVIHIVTHTILHNINSQTIYNIIITLITLKR